MEQLKEEERAGGMRDSHASVYAQQGEQLDGCCIVQGTVVMSLSSESNSKGQLQWFPEEGTVVYKDNASASNDVLYAKYTGDAWVSPLGDITQDDDTDKPGHCIIRLVLGSRNKEHATWFYAKLKNEQLKMFRENHLAARPTWRSHMHW